MILSMTGYGDAQGSQDGVSYALEIRSLNNRYFKAAIKLPEHLQFLDADVEKLLRSRVGRGSISYSLRARDTSAEAAYEVNIAAVESYLKQLKDAAGQRGSVSIDLAMILALPGVCQPRELDPSQRERQWLLIEQLTNAAVDRLLTMRRDEGKALREVLLRHCAALREHLARIGERAPEVVTDYQDRLRQRVNVLLAGAQLELDRDDLIKEVAIFAERCDIREEADRLGSHLDQFEAVCDSTEHAGRKLDFLAQEMLREANTIGSKANDPAIAVRIVEVKALIDRLKEQVQNVE